MQQRVVKVLFQKTNWLTRLYPRPEGVDVVGICDRTYLTPERVRMLVTDR